LDPKRLAAEAGVPFEALVNPDLKIPNLSVGAIYRLAVEWSGAHDVALRVVERRRLSNLGAVGLAMHHQASVRDAADIMVRYFVVHNEAVGISMRDDGDVTELQVF